MYSSKATVFITFISVTTQMLMPFLSIISDYIFLLSFRPLCLIETSVQLFYKHFKVYKVKSEHIIIQYSPSQVTFFSCSLSWILTSLLGYSSPRCGYHSRTFLQNLGCHSRIFFFSHLQYPIIP